MKRSAGIQETAAFTPEPDGSGEGIAQDPAGCHAAQGSEDRKAYIRLTNELVALLLNLGVLVDMMRMRERCDAAFSSRMVALSNKLGHEIIHIRDLKERLEEGW